MEFLYYLCTQVCCTIILLHQVSDFETAVNNIYLFFSFVIFQNGLFSVSLRILKLFLYFFCCLPLW
uniref:Uncharacterized protein n=1 Tax=Anguilla anguilla TaxID=7936 RepID=A0A0E9V6V7_ANGAN